MEQKHLVCTCDLAWEYRETGEDVTTQLPTILVIEDEHLFLLFYRPKGDKIGDNISIKNPAFKAALVKYVALLRSDIANVLIEEIIVS